MKNRKDKAEAEPKSAVRTGPTKARTAGGKKLNPQVMASAEQKALEGLKQRTEEGHLKAGRTPPSQQEGRRSGATRVVDDAIRDAAPVTEDEKLLQQSGPRLDFTRTDPWRVLRIMKKLRSLSGKDFDRAFLQHEIDFHNAVIDAVTTTLLPATKNAQLKDLETKVAPAFVAHRDRAQNLLDHLK